MGTIRQLVLAAAFAATALIGSGHAALAASATESGFVVLDSNHRDNGKVLHAPSVAGASVVETNVASMGRSLQRSRLPQEALKTIITPETEVHLEKVG